MSMNKAITKFVLAGILICGLPVTAMAVISVAGPTAGSQFRVGASIATGGMCDANDGGTVQQGEMVANVWTGFGSSPSLYKPSNPMSWTIADMTTNPPTAITFTAQLNGPGGVGFKVKVTPQDGSAVKYSGFYTVIP